MSLSILRYKTLTLRYNPHTFSVITSRSLFRRTAPGLGEIIGENAVLARTVRGEGELFGEDAFEQYLRLQEEFSEPGEGPLQLPGLSPFPAFFTGLSLTGKAGVESLSYSFEFCEKPRFQPVQRVARSPEYHIAHKGETLWEIAAQYSISVEDLISLGAEPRNMQEGERVRLR